MKAKRIIRYGRTAAADRAMRATLMEFKDKTSFQIQHTPDDPSFDPELYPEESGEFDTEELAATERFKERCMAVPPPRPRVRTGPMELPIKRN